MKHDWTAEEKLELVLDILSGEISVEDAALSHGFDAAVIESWKILYLQGAKHALCTTKPTFLRRLKSATQGVPLRIAGLAIASMCVLLVSVVATSGDPPGCDDSDPTNPELCQFKAGEPAIAQEVNSNFFKLKEWLVSKVGPVDTPDITGADLIEGEDGLQLRGQPGNGDDFSISATGDVAVGQNLQVAGSAVVNNDLAVDGGLTISGDLTFNVYKARYQRDDDPEATYNISPRYHLSLTAPNYAGKSKEIPPATLEALCGDSDGCEVRLGMTFWNGVESETASRIFTFYYVASDGRWRTSEDVYGIDGNDSTQHAKNIWDTCYFTDGIYSGYANQGDSGKGMNLLLWNGYSGANRTCELTLID